MAFELQNFFNIFLLFNSALCAVNNVLFIIIDDLRPEIGAFGGAALTPNIDQIANTGIVFKNAFAQISLCAPSRNSFLTSRRPDSLKLYDFYSYWRDVAGNYTTLPQYLKENGYETYSIGKVFHPGQSSNFTDDFPFSWSKQPWHPKTDKYKDDPVCYSNGKWRSNLVCPVNVEEQPEGTLPDIESTGKAVEFLRERGNESRPFFLALGYHKPHIPLKFPKKYLNLYPLDEIKLPDVRSKPHGLPEVAWNPWNDLRERDDIKDLNLTFPYEPIPDEMSKIIRQGYYSAVSYVDDLVGEVLKALTENGLDRSTVIILVGDHGWSLGEHGEWAKFSNFDRALRSPLSIKVPNLTNGNKISDIVELVDIFPTVVDIIGLPPIPSCTYRGELLCTEGRSLLPLILGGKILKRPALSQYPRPGTKPTRKPNSDRPKLGEITVMGYTARTSRYRFTQWVSWKNFTPNWFDVKGTELYDHFTDPDENCNLAGELGGISGMLRYLTPEINFLREKNLSSQTLVIDLSKVVHVTSEKFLSFALDSSFVSKTLPNLTNWDEFIKLSKNLAPAILRLGGTDADRLIFAETAKTGFVILKPNEWLQFNNFALKSKLSILFYFNVLLRKGKNWDPTNAEEILMFTRKHNLPLGFFQLGNEPNSFPHVFNVTISPKNLGDGFRKLRELVDDDSMIIGPDVTNPRLSLEEKIPSLDYLKEFLNTSIDAIDAVSWHHYYLNGRTSTLEDFLSPETMNSFVVQVEAIKAVTRGVSGKIPIWITETGSAYGGGAANLSDRYVSMFLFLDKLGMGAVQGMDVIIRQTLYGGHYAMLNDNFDPNPDFWLAVLFKKLVGTNVYSVKSDNPLFRCYMHSSLTLPCLANSSMNASNIFFCMNLGGNFLDLRVRATKDLFLCASYVLTAPDGNLQSRDVLLNNYLLNWNRVKNSMDTFLRDFGDVEGKNVSPPFSIGFYVFSVIES